MKQALALSMISLALAVAACSRSAGASSDGGDQASRTTRGRYLVEAIGCSDCHTPKTLGPNGPELDNTRLLAGHPEQPQLPAPPAPGGPWAATGTWDLTAWSGPWGISYAANLTPDDNTGIGIWTEQMFLSALKTGRHMGTARPILPPMPWQAFKNLTDDDLKAVFAYLRTVPAIHNRVPDPVSPAVATH